VGDPHGCLKTLEALIAKVRVDFPDDQVCIAGDLIDRGPLSAQLIQYVIDNNILCVLGNHEQMMIDGTTEDGTLESYFFSNMWAGNGGTETIKDYHIDPPEGEENNIPGFGLNLNHELLKKHRKWLLNLPLYLEFPDIKDDQGRHLLVTHSSAHLCWKWTEKQREENSTSFKNHLIWGRNKNYKPIEGVYNIFGHTPYRACSEKDLKIESFYANIDTGAVFKSAWESGYGKMTALVFPQMKVYQQENRDDSKY